MREFCRRARCPALRQARDPMPLGFEDPQESNFHLRLIVPEGHLRIAQGFNLGYGVIERIESRRGRLNCWSTLSRPFGGCYETQKLRFGFYCVKLTLFNLEARLGVRNLPGCKTRPEAGFYGTVLYSTTTPPDVTFSINLETHVFRAWPSAEQTLTNHFVTPSSGTTLCKSHPQSSLRDSWS